MLRDDELLKIIDDAIERYQGNATVLEGAVGALMVGRLVGWKPLVMIHAKPTIKRYEKVLDVDFRMVLRPDGCLARKSVAWRVVEAGKHFWDVVNNRVLGRSPVLE